MFKKTSSRNQRSKDIRIKHVLQMCLLLGVCFWLIYQLKHSHDKRKEFDAKGAKVSVKEQTDDLILKFGRKDLPRVQEVAKNYKHEEEKEEENGLEDENKHDEEHEEKSKRLEEDEHEGASKHEEDEHEGASKHEEEEKDGGSKHREEEQEETIKHEDDEEGTIKHDEEEEDPEEVGGDEGSKHDDEEQEAEVKDEEAEDEGKGDGDDEVDGNEQERDDGEVDREELMDDEKERETGDIENEGKENEENEQLANDRNLDGGDGDAHEAREKHYTADDASSAVSHDTQSTSSEADKLEAENSNGNSARNVLEQESKVNATEKTDGDENKSELKVDEGGSSSDSDENKSELKVDEGGSSSDSDENKSELKVDEDKHSESDNSLNVTHTKENDHETGSANSQHISLPTTNTTDFIDQASNITTEVSKEAGNIDVKANTAMPGSLQNGTSVEDTREDGMVTEEKYKERANETTSNSQQFDSNTVDASKIGNVDSTTTESSNSWTHADSGMSDDTLRINATAGGQSSESSMMKEDTDSTQREKPEGDNESSGTDESSDTSSTIDSSDSALSEEEKDSGVDLSTLLDITTGGSNNEDTVAE